MAGKSGNKNGKKGTNAKNKAAGSVDGSGLVAAISAALEDHGVPDGSVVDVTGGPAEGLVFTVGDDDATAE